MNNNYFGTFPTPGKKKKVKLNNDIETSLIPLSFLDTVKLVTCINESLQSKEIVETLKKAFPDTEIEGRDFTEIMQLVSLLMENLNQ